jgi:tRNA-splicing ligase RtcB
VFVTRKGAINAEDGRYGIIPGSMGAKSFIIKGLGNPESFNSCSHGAGRKMSRTKAKAKYTLEDLKKQTAGVECRKDKASSMRFRELTRTSKRSCTPSATWSKSLPS